MQELLDLIPEVVVIGDLEYLFIGAATALGFPKLATYALEQRYGTDLNGDGEVGQPTDSTNE